MYEEACDGGHRQDRERGRKSRMVAQGAGPEAWVRAEQVVVATESSGRCGAPINGCR